MSKIACLDWGGTKISAICIVEGKLVAEKEIPAANIRTVSDIALERICNELKQLTGESCAHLTWVIGAAGAGDCRAAARIEKKLQEISGSGSKYLIFPDYICNHAAAFAAGPGILSINGTGSLIFAEKNEKSVMVGGWGYLLDEAPSGAFFGRQTLKSVLEFLEGNHDCEGIADEFSRQHFPPERSRILDQLYRADNLQHQLGRFARVLTSCYDNHDPQAMAIVSASVAILIRQLKQAASLGHEAPDLAISGWGGLWQNWSAFHNIVEIAIKKADLQQKFQQPIYKPVFGPLLYQAKFDSMLKEALVSIPEEEKRYVPEP